jgi:hypothetical protein
MNEKPPYLNISSHKLLVASVCLVHVELFVWGLNVYHNCVSPKGWTEASPNVSRESISIYSNWEVVQKVA